MRWLGVVCVVVCASLVSGQTDGNPHNWDRRRRCDTIDYDPPCGPCEGYGGIPYGDQNDEITLTTCEVVANKSAIDRASLRRPIWGSQFTIKKYYEVLVGKKTDPFCFNSFPNNSSVGPLCYRHQQGSQVTQSHAPVHALRYDLQVETILGNVSSVVIHKDQYMWIVNKLPWYTANTRQCICTYPKPVDIPDVFPIQYNWTDNLQFVAREHIGVEFIYTNQVLDHWAFGPHHVWTLPENGQVLRMWQPFNGLEVFPDGANATSVNDTIFEGLPPPLCQKGGALWRIGCTDEGYPAPQSDLVSAEVPFLQPDGLPDEVTTSTPSSRDFRRAVQKVPRHSYRGQDFEEMSRVLNGWLEESDAIGTRPCEEWRADEIQQLQFLLYSLRHSDLDAIYQNTSDNRRLIQDIEELQDTWRGLNDHVSNSSEPVLAAMQRDGHCHEAVMWYVHHLSETVKQTLRDANVVIPLLSYSPHSCPENVLGNDSKGAAVCKMYAQQVTCQSCHANVTAPHDWLANTHPGMP